MSRSYKQPIVRDKMGSSNKKMYERIYRAKVSSYMNNNVRPFINNKISLDDYELLIDISNKTIPTREEAFEYWNLCDYVIDYRPQCCSSERYRYYCYNFPDMAFYMFKEHVLDICAACRKRFTRK